MLRLPRSRIRKTERLINARQLREACSIVRDYRLATKSQAKPVVNRLIDALIRQAQRLSAGHDFQAAWENLDLASTIPLARSENALAQETSRLVDLSIEHAEQLLRDQKPMEAAGLVSLLADRQMMDHRAAAIWRACQVAKLAESDLAQGKISVALERIHQELDQNNYARFLSCRVATLESLQRQFKKLNSQLEHALLVEDWDAAKLAAQKLLNLAPDNAIASDALRQCNAALASKPHPRVKKLQPELYIGDSAGHLSDPGAQPGWPSREPSPNSDIKIIDTELTKRTSGKKRASAQPPASHLEWTKGSGESTTYAGSRGLSQRGERIQSNSDAPSGLSNISSLASEFPKLAPFFLWIDEIGGFWVVVNDQVTLGAETASANLDVPIRGLPHQFKLSWSRVDGLYLVHPNPAAALLVDEMLVDSEMILDKQHRIQSRDLILAFRKPHVLSETATLTIESRHRTNPHTDGILLMDRSIVMGPSRASHIVCPGWSQQVVLYQERGKLHCSSNVDYLVDGIVESGKTRLGPNSRISGSDFSMALEPVPDLFH